DRCAEDPGVWSDPVALGWDEAGVHGDERKGSVAMGKGDGARHVLAATRPAHVVFGEARATEHHIAKLELAASIRTHAKGFDVVRRLRGGGGGVRCVSGGWGGRERCG